MASTATLFLLPSAGLKQSQIADLKNKSRSRRSSSPVVGDRRFPCRRNWNRNRSVVAPVARLFGPAIFEASKLKVMFLGIDQEEHPGQLPRTYTLTHSDVTSKITLAISQSINRAQFEGWYSQLQRDEVVAEWKKVKGKMSLHVHCHISGGHFLLDFIAKLRFYIFYKELPVVLKAFVHGDMDLFNSHPDLGDALVWVYFHSNLPEYNRVECWGPLWEATASGHAHPRAAAEANPSACPAVRPQKCPKDCSCCFPHHSSIPWAHAFDAHHNHHHHTHAHPEPHQQI